MSLPGSSAQQAVSPDNRDDCRRAGAAVLHVLERSITPRQIMNGEAFENSITVTIAIALGSSTKAVLHLIAMADVVGVPGARRLHTLPEARRDDRHARDAVTDSAIMGRGLSDSALITDGRLSGGSHGFVVGHVTPEASNGDR